MVSRNAFGKSRGTPGVEDIGEVLHGIKRNRFLQRRMAQKGSKGMDPAVPVHFACRDFVKQDSQGSFPERKQIHQVGDNGVFQAGLVKHLLYIAEVCIQADHGFRAGIVDHVFDLKRGVNWGHRHKNGAQFLDGKKSNDPLHAVGDIDHDLVAFFDPHVRQGACKPFAQIPKAGVAE